MRAPRSLIISGILALPVLFMLSISMPLPNLALSAPHQSFFMTAAADDDEDEDEDEEEEEDDEESTPEKTTRTKTVKIIKEVIEYRSVTEAVVVTEEAYAKDTDGDLLVDAVDPDPLLPQSEYFTDTDDDGVPNALDRYHDEDDFSYYEFETDDNNNGILDSYEG